MKLRDALILLRSETGLSQSELADRLGVVYAAVNRWENGRSVPGHKSSLAIIRFAQNSNVSGNCMEALKRALNADKLNMNCCDNGDNSMAYRIQPHESQLGEVLNNICVGIVGMRFSTTDTTSMDAFYFNEYIPKMLGYTYEEYSEIFYKDPYMVLSKENVSSYRFEIAQLISGAITPAKFHEVVHFIDKNGNTVWSRVRVITARIVNGVQEYYFSCENISELVVAQQKYELELSYRKAFLVNAPIWAHCNITGNSIINIKYTDAVTAKNMREGSYDGMLRVLMHGATDEQDKERILAAINRETLIDKYNDTGASERIIFYDKKTNCWSLCRYFLIKNPITMDIEAFIYVMDYNKQKMLGDVITIFADLFFDFVGTIDIASGNYCELYRNDSDYCVAESRITNYSTEYSTLIERYVSDSESRALTDSICIENIIEGLKKDSVYSVFYHIDKIPGDNRYKKIAYSYSDESHNSLIIAQSDMGEISKLAGIQLSEQNANCR